MPAPTGVSGATNSSAHGKSTKFPDPTIFTDGNDPIFERWLPTMRSKLVANADHYSTEALRRAYVENRVGGDAMVIFGLSYQKCLKTQSGLSLGGKLHCILHSKISSEITSTGCIFSALFEPLCNK